MNGRAGGTRVSARVVVIDAHAVRSRNLEAVDAHAGHLVSEPTDVVMVLQP